MKPRKENIGHAGFTLLELIAVMAIIVTMSLVVVGGYIGIIRTINKSTAINTLRDTAVLCRQTAVLDGRETYCFVTGINRFRLCSYAGVVSGLEKNGSKWIPYLGGSDESGAEKNDAAWLTDEFADWSSQERIATQDKTQFDKARLREAEFGNQEVFDIDKRRSARIKYPPFLDGKDIWTLGLYTEDIKSGMFDEGNRYGWTLGEEKSLPKGYVFKSNLYKLDNDGEFDSGYCFFFSPDGSCQSIKKGASGVTDGATLTVGELSPASAGGDTLLNEQTLTISSGGKATVKKD